MGVDYDQIRNDLVILGIVDKDDDYILAEMNEITRGDWWEDCINSENEEAFWSFYYNRCEEIAIERGLI